MTPSKETAAPATPKKKSAKVSREPKPKKEGSKQPLVVFAFRLTAAERDLIHKAAGSGKATRLVRGAALAAANGDIKAFETLLASCKPAK